MADNKSKKTKSQGQSDAKSRKSHVLAMVMQFESKAAEAAAAAEPPKKALLKKDAPVEASQESKLDSIGSTRQSRRKESLKSAAVQVNRVLLKELKQFYYGKLSESAKSWTDKVVGDLCKVALSNKSNKGDKSVAATHSDDSGDADVPCTDSPKSGQTMLLNDMSSGDADQSKDEKDLPELDMEEQFRFFSEKMRLILSKASGFAMTDIGLTLDDFCALLQQYKLTTAQQLLDEVSKMPLLYQPQITVLQRHEHIQPRDPTLLPAKQILLSGGTISEKAPSMQVVVEEVYFYPKLIFQ